MVNFGCGTGVAVGSGAVKQKKEFFDGRSSISARRYVVLDRYGDYLRCFLLGLDGNRRRKTRSFVMAAINYIGLICLLVLSAFTGERSQQRAKNTAYEACFASETALTTSSSMELSVVEFLSKKSDNVLLRGGGMSEGRSWGVKNWVNKNVRAVYVAASAMLVTVSSTVVVMWSVIPDSSKFSLVIFVGLCVVVSVLSILSYLHDHKKLNEELKDRKSKIEVSEEKLKLKYEALESNLKNKLNSEHRARMKELELEHNAHVNKLGWDHDANTRELKRVYAARTKELERNYATRVESLELDTERSLGKFQKEMEDRNEASDRATVRFVEDTIMFAYGIGVWLSEDSVEEREGVYYYPFDSLAYESLEKMYDFARSINHTKAERFKTPISADSVHASGKVYRKKNEETFEGGAGI